MEGFFSTMAANHAPAPPPNHQRTSQNNVKQFKCDLCDKSFTQRRNQRAHIRTVHEKLKPFQCTHCGLTANRKFNLMSHIKKMHGSVEGNSVIDRRLSGGNNVVQSSANNSGVGGGHNSHSGSGSGSSGSKKSKSSSSHNNSSHNNASSHHSSVATNTDVTTAPSANQCLVCQAPKLSLTKYFCDKCDQRFTTPVPNNAPSMVNMLSNVQGRNFHSPQTTQHQPHHPQTFRCLQCQFFTDDSNAMIGHHLHAHSSYPMPM